MSINIDILEGASSGSTALVLWEPAAESSTQETLTTDIIMKTGASTLPDIELNVEANVASELMQLEASPPSCTVRNLRRQRPATTDQSKPNPKRVAVDSATLHARAADEEVETQLAEQILHNEMEASQLRVVNDQLNEKLQFGSEQYEQLKRFNQEMSTKLDSLQTQNECEQAAHDNEISMLCQHLQAAEASSSKPSNTTPPWTQPTMFLRGMPTQVGVVPLRPVAVPAATRREANTDTPAADMSTPQGVDHMRSVVAEVLHQLNVGVTVSKTGPGRRRKSAQTHNRDDIQRQKQTLSQEQDLAWKNAIRTAWKAFFNVATITKFECYTPALDTAVAQYEHGSNGPDNTNKLDFRKGYEKSRWNKVILTRICDEILEDRDNDGSWGIPDVSDEYIMALLYGQLKRSCEAWRSFQTHPNYDEGRMETSEEVSVRVKETVWKSALTLLAIEPAMNKFERRRKAVENIITLKTTSQQPDLETWKYFRNLLEKLTIDGMSSEEDGVERMGEINVQVFQVKLCIWRNPVIRDYFKYIDSESQNPAVRPSRGSKLLPRIQTDVPGDTNPPPKLPVRLFDPIWLSKEERVKGKQWIDEELLVSREVFELLEFVAQ